MPGTTTLVWTALQPALAGTAFGDYCSRPPADDGSDGFVGRPVADVLPELALRVAAVLG